MTCLKKRYISKVSYVTSIYKCYERKEKQKLQTEEDESERYNYVAFQNHILLHQTKKNELLQEIKKTTVLPIPSQLSPQLKGSSLSFLATF
jgi:hypothetical protein